MELKFLLLVMAQLLLIDAAPTNTSIHANLRHIINEIEKVNQTVAREFFVEDVQDLVDEGCPNTFFCKVQHILENHLKEPTSKIHLGEGLLRNLKAFTGKCPDEAKEQKITRKPITKLLENIKECCRQRNMRLQP